MLTESSKEMPENSTDKLGYKETELGWIPEDWNIEVLENLSEKIGDGIHTTPKYSVNGDYFFINGNNLIEGKIVISDNTKKVSKEEYVFHKRDLNKFSVLISINGTIGNIAFYNGEKILLGKSAAYITLNNKKIDKKYYFQMVQTGLVKAQFENELTGTTIKNLGLRAIRNSLIPIPPTLAEQTAIATALSDMDGYISSLEKLIAKKRLIKQGAMQVLLTPKEDWEEGYIKEIGLPI